MSSPAVATIIPIPGHDCPNLVGAGFQDRALTLHGYNFDGAWVQDRRYYRCHDHTRSLECIEVCWLEVGGKIENVPAGRWEATVLLKFDNQHSQRLNAVWNIYAEHANGEQQSLSFFTSDRRGANLKGVFPVAEWVRLSFGVFRLSSPCNTICLKVFGRNSWCGGFHFGDLQLRACGIEWQKERLLVLCLMKKANDREGECLLQELPKHVIGLIGQMLITPLPEEVNRFGSLFKS